MNNKKVLSKIDLGSFIKPNPYKKDIIYDPKGQWEHPGENTRIPGGDITMQGVDYPVWAQPSVGPGTMMQPGQDYNFPGAEYVDEYPQMKKGGSKKKYSKYTRNILATNRLLVVGDLFKKPKKNQIFDPNASFYEDGGQTNDYIETELTDDEIQAYRDGGYVVEESNEYKKGGALLTKKVTCKKCGWEWDAADGGDDITICHKCGGQGLVHAPNGGAPIPKGYQAALSQYVNPVINETDEHTGYNAATGEVNRDTRPGSIENNNWWMEHEKFHHLQNLSGGLNTAGVVGQRPNNTVASDESMQGYYNRRSNEVEAQTDKMIAENPDLQFIPREKLIQSIFPVEGEQPSFVGAGDLIYADPSTVEGEARVYEQYIKQGGKSVFSEKKNGGEYFEMDLTPEEIQEYAKGGYMVEDISVPSLNQMQDGNEVTPVTAPQRDQYIQNQSQQLGIAPIEPPIQQIAPVVPVVQEQPKVPTAPISVTNDPIPVDNSVIATQKKLKAAGYDLGKYGPNGDGVDGQMGNKTKLALDAFNAGIPPSKVKPVNPTEKVKGQTNNYRVNTELKDGYLPYLSQGEETCVKGKGCSANVSIKMGNLLGNITDDSLWANDAWFNKSDILNKGGDFVYENKERDFSKMQKVPKDVWSK